MDADNSTPLVPSSAVLLQAVVKSYVSNAVIRGVTLVVPCGELVAITGHSGSGKSTLLRMMQGIERPDSGTVTLLDHDLGQLPARSLGRLIRGHVGVGFQAPMLDGNFSLADNIRLVANAKGYRVSNRHMAHLAKSFGLEQRMFQNAATCSGGEQMRASLVRTLIKKPTILLLDEPTGALDTASSKRVFGGLRAVVKQDNTTVVMVTHDGDVARKYVDREFVIESGELVATEVYGR